MHEPVPLSRKPGTFQLNSDKKVILIFTVG